MRYLCLLVLPFLLANCSAHLSLVTPPEEGDVPILSEERNKLLSAFVEKTNEISSMRSLQDIYLESERAQFRQVIAFMLPDKLRVEVFAPGINAVQMFVVASAGKLYAADDTGEEIRTNARAEVLEELLGLPFEPKELMLWIVGRVDGKVLSRSRWSRVGAEIFVVDDADSTEKHSVVLELVDGIPIVKTIEIIRDDTHVLSAFRKYKAKQGVLIPSEIHLSIINRSVRAIISSRFSELNSIQTGQAQRLFAFPE